MPYADRQKQREFQRQWRAAHKERMNQQTKVWREAHPEMASVYKKKHYVSNAARILKRQATFRAAHRDKIREASRTYYQANRAKVLITCRANNPRRRAAARQATPVWADARAMRAIYEEAVRLTGATGIRHEVDHFYPLRGKTVCGLHCEANLRIVTADVNRQKNNRHPMEIALRS